MILKRDFKWIIILLFLFNFCHLSVFPKPRVSVTQIGTILTTESECSNCKEITAWSTGQVSNRKFVAEFAVSCAGVSTKKVHSVLSGIDIFWLPLLRSSCGIVAANFCIIWKNEQKERRRQNSKNTVSLFALTPGALTLKQPRASHWRVKSSGVRHSKVYKCHECTYGRESVKPSLLRLQISSAMAFVQIKDIYNLRYFLNSANWTISSFDSNATLRHLFKTIGLNS